MDLKVDELISVYEDIESFLKKLDKEIKALEVSINEK